jgi:hypothetical protein
MSLHVGLVLVICVKALDSAPRTCASGWCDGPSLPIVDNADSLEVYCTPALAARDFCEDRFLGEEACSYIEAAVIEKCSSVNNEGKLLDPGNMPTFTLYSRKLSQFFDWPRPVTFNKVPFKMNVEGTQTWVNNTAEATALCKQLSSSDCRRLLSTLDPRGEERWSSLELISLQYEDIKESHEEFLNGFAVQLMGSRNPMLLAHMEFVRQRQFGFTSQGVWWMWKILVDAMPQQFTFLEIGVYKAATPSLIQLLANQASKQAKVYGVTPLGEPAPEKQGAGKRDVSNILFDDHGSKKYSAGEEHTKTHFLGSIRQLYKAFLMNAETDLELLIGYSNDEDILARVNKLPFLDILLVDGDHTHQV